MGYSEFIDTVDEYLKKQLELIEFKIVEEVEDSFIQYLASKFSDINHLTQSLINAPAEINKLKDRLYLEYLKQAQDIHTELQKLPLQTCIDLLPFLSGKEEQPNFNLAIQIFDTLKIQKHIHDVLETQSAINLRGAPTQAQIPLKQASERFKLPISVLKSGQEPEPEAEIDNEEIVKIRSSAVDEKSKKRNIKSYLETPHIYVKGSKFYLLLRVASPECIDSFFKVTHPRIQPSQYFFETNYLDMVKINEHFQKEISSINEKILELKTMPTVEHVEQEDVKSLKTKIIELNQQKQEVLNREKQEKYEEIQVVKAQCENKALQLSESIKNTNLSDELRQALVQEKAAIEDLIKKINGLGIESFSRKVEVDANHIDFKLLIQDLSKYESLVTEIQSFAPLNIPDQIGEVTQDIDRSLKELVTQNPNSYKALQLGEFLEKRKTIQEFYASFKQNMPSTLLDGLNLDPEPKKCYMNFLELYYLQKLEELVIILDSDNFPILSNSFIAPSTIPQLTQAIENEITRLQKVIAADIQISADNPKYIRQYLTKLTCPSLNSIQDIQSALQDQISLKVLETQSQLAVAHRELETLKKSPSQMHTTNQQLSQELAELKLQLVSKDRQIEAFGQQRASAEMSQQLEELRRVNARLQTELSHIQSSSSPSSGRSINSAQQNSVSAMEENAAQISQLQQELLQTQQTLKTSQSQTNRLQQQLDKLDALVNFQEGQIKAHPMQLEVIRAENQEFQTQLLEKESENDSYLQTFQMLQEKFINEFQTSYQQYEELLEKHKKANEYLEDPENAVDLELSQELSTEYSEIANLKLKLSEHYSQILDEFQIILKETKDYLSQNNLIEAYDSHIKTLGLLEDLKRIVKEHTELTAKQIELITNFDDIDAIQRNVSNGDSPIIPDSDELPSHSSLIDPRYHFDSIFSRPSSPYLEPSGDELDSQLAAHLLSASSFLHPNEDGERSDFSSSYLAPSEEHEWKLYAQSNQPDIKRSLEDNLNNSVSETINTKTHKTFEQGNGQKVYVPATGHPYQFYYKKGDAPRATLFEKDVGKPSDTDYHKKLALDVINMIDNIISKGSTLYLDTKDDFVASIASLYVEHINQNQNDIKITGHITLGEREILSNTTYAFNIFQELKQKVSAIQTIEDAKWFAEAVTHYHPDGNSSVLRSI